MAQFKPDFEPGGRATYERAQRGYDAEHERELLKAITEAVLATSRLSDVDAVALRTGEATQALLTALACVLAMSAATRSPTATRKTIDDFGKSLRRRIFSAKQSEDLQDFMRRTFNGGPEGNA